MHLPKPGIAVSHNELSSRGGEKEIPMLHINENQKPGVKIIYSHHRSYRAGTNITRDCVSTQCICGRDMVEAEYYRVLWLTQYTPVEA